jgi:hypothetical protein
LADDTSRIGVVAPRLRAISPTASNSHSPAFHGSARSPGAISSGCGRYRNDGSSGSASTVPGAVSWGTGSTPCAVFSPSLASRSTYDRALWVVPRSMPIA